MKREQVLNLSSMPAAGPSYPFGPHRFVDREYFIVTYESDPAAVRDGVPEPLMPVPNATVYYEWIEMPNSSSFGSYTESGVVIPCTFEDEPCNFVSQI